MNAVCGFMIVIQMLLVPILKDLTIVHVMLGFLATGRIAQVSWFLCSIYFSCSMQFEGKCSDILLSTECKVIIGMFYHFIQMINCANCFKELYEKFSSTFISYGKIT